MSAKNNTVFFFGYSWNQARKLDAYQASLVEEFKNFGFDVHIFYSNLYSNQDAVYGVFRGFEKAILREIKIYKPSIVLSMNQGLLTDRVCSALPETTDIYTWIVDDPAHLFYPSTPTRGHEVCPILPPRVKVIVSSSEIYRYFLKKDPGLLPENLILISSVSDFLLFRTVKFEAKRNIVFIGSYLDTHVALTLLQSAHRDAEMRDILMSILRKMALDYNDNSIPEYKNEKVLALLKKHGFNLSQFKIYMSNLISTNLRENAVRKLLDLGIEVFGNVEWVQGLRSDLELLNCFQSQEVYSRADLINIYQTSKISIQVAQVQVGASLSYRIFDILSSDSLLIHPYHPQSDLVHFFGEDCPVPVYRDLDELHRLCKYYLENEEERLRVVKACQELVRHGFSFSDRVKMMTGNRVGHLGSAKIHDRFRRRLSLSYTATVMFTLRLIFQNPRMAGAIVARRMLVFIRRLKGGRL